MYQLSECCSFYISRYLKLTVIAVLITAFGDDCCYQFRRYWSTAEINGHRCLTPFWNNWYQFWRFSYIPSSRITNTADWRFFEYARWNIKDIAIKRRFETIEPPILLGWKPCLRFARWNTLKISGYCLSLFWQDRYWLRLSQ